MTSRYPHSLALPATLNPSLRRPRKTISSSMVAMAVTAALFTPGAATAIDMWAMSKGGSDAELYSIDVAANLSTLVGKLRDPLLPNDPPGNGWSTVAETPDKTLYFLRRYTNDVHVFSLDATNILTNGSGVITNVISRGSTGLSGNLDGLTAGPDGNLYFTAYVNDTLNTGAPRNGLFRFYLPPPNPCPLCTASTLDGQPQPYTTQLVGTFKNSGINNGNGQINSFYTDLAFDPITGDLVGTGYNGSNRFIPWRLDNATALNAKNQLFDYVNAFPNWDDKMYDGIAFNRLNGDLYASGDDSGVYQIDRSTGLIMKDPVTGKLINIGDNANPPDLRRIGTDLAIQADTIPSVPEPAAAALLAVGLAMLGGAVRRRARSA